jgi:hypothetical protein
MAKQKILIELQVVDKNATKSTQQFKQSVDGVTKAQQDYFKALQPSNVQIEKYKLLTAQATAATKAKAMAELNAASATKEGRTQSGLNNAILLETGRLASDASYGFTAIANNLSQVVTLFSSFVKTQDSVKDSFKELGKSIMGTGGLLIAVQLLISFGPKIYDFFQGLLGQSRLLSETFKDAGSEVESSAGKFETYIGTLESATKSSAEKERAIKKLNKEFPDYIKSLDQAGVSLDDVKNGTDSATKANDEYRDSLLELAMARAAQNKIDELAAEQLQVEIDFNQKIKDQGIEMTKERYEELTSEIELIKQKELSSRREEQLIDKIIDARERRYLKARENFEEDQDRIEKDIETLVEYTKIEDEENKKRGGSRRERSRMFKEADLDYEKEILKSQDRVKKLETTNQFDLLHIELQGIADRSNLKQKEFEEDQLRRLKDFKDKEDLRLKDFKLSGASAEEIAKAEAKVRDSKLAAEEKYNNSVAESRESLYKFLTQLDTEYVERSSDIKEKQELDDVSKFGQLLGVFNTDRLKFQEDFLSKYTDSEIDRVGVAKQLEADRFQNEMTNLNRKLTAAEEAEESTYAIEQEIANARKLNSEANIALSEQERDAKIAIANQVGDAIIKVAGEGSTVGKSVAVAQAIMNTREAFTAALGAKPYGPWNIAQAAATLAMGFQQVKKIMSTKIEGKDPSGGDTGGGAGGSVIQAPDFNVVGASAESQLAQTVSSAQAAPVKAFVVSKDISTQQELDRNTTNIASFG